MTTRLLLALSLSALLLACGGGDDDSGGSGGGTNPAGTSAMAAAFATELGTIKTCVQGQVDGKGDCTINFLQDPVTRMCSDVRTGKPNPSFPGADFSKFTKTCDNWASVLGLDAASKVNLLTTMTTEVEALK